MAANRPLVLVFQEFATLSSSPATPELNCLIAGPAYWIQDFPEDRADMQIDDYGIDPASAASGSAVFTSAVTVADAPNNKIGAILDQASVRVFTSKTLVEMAFGTDMDTTITPLPTPVVSSAATDFVAAGVLPLDTIVMTDLANVTISRTIVSVTTNTLTLNSETPATFNIPESATVKFRIHRALPESELDSSYLTFVPATNTITVDPLATLPVGVNQKLIVSCELYVAYRSLRLDLSDVKTLGSVNEVNGQLGRIDSRNPLAVGVFVALQNTNTTVQYFGINEDSLAGYTSMKNSISGRKDIYAVTPLSSDILVLAMLKAEFQALADPDVALVNGVPQKFRVAIGSSAAVPLTKIIIDKNTDGKTEITASLPTPTTYHTLTFDTDVAFLAANVLPGDQLVITADSTTPTAASGVLTITGQPANNTTVTTGTKTYTFKSVYTNINGAVTIAGTAQLTLDNLMNAINLAGVPGVDYAAVMSANGFVTAAAGGPLVLNLTAIVSGVAGNSIATTETLPLGSFGALTLTGGVGANRNGTYTVAQVLSNTSLEVNEEVLGGAQSANATIQIRVGTSVLADRVPITAITPLATILDSKLFLDLYDANGTFIDDGIIPTDLVEMPQNPMQGSFTVKDSFQVALVVSNQRLRIVNNGRNNSLTANELPHGVSRNSPDTVIATTGVLTYRITRTLDKAGQVTEIVAVTQSIASRRVINVWPDLCDVGGLVDGSLPRDPLAPTVAQPAASQPGYYLACAVGGMTAGLPSQQGFTNLGIAGISKIYDSNTLFSDAEITKISNGGWFVFQQDTPAALPYVVHQLTTDVATLQSGEYSMVKNFDFVSIFFADILDDYLGIWNINPETIGFITASVLAGVDNLKLRRKPRIGAPIVDGQLVSIGVSTVSADRVEIVVEIQFPAPLNIVAIHLISA